MQTAKLTAAAMALSALPLFGETMNGDITAAVRASGGTPTVSSVPAVGQTGSCANTGLFDGLVSIGDAGYPSSGQRFFFQWSAANSFELCYTVPDTFCAGEDIVVTGVVFAVGRAKSDGSQPFTNYETRMPLAWTLEGSNGAGAWENIVTVTNQSGYSLSKHNGVSDVYSGSCDIANSTSYRSYRITITKNTGDATYMIQLTEVKLLGFYGGSYSFAPCREDLTAAARGIPSACTISSPNLTAAMGGAIAMSVDKAFDGSVTDGGTDRFLATADSTAAAFAGGGAIVEYDFNDEFRCGGDIVVTGYTLDTQTSQGGSDGSVALQRMPKSWVFEAYDESAGAWVELDGYDGFMEWETRDVGGYSQYITDFSFPNTKSYRKYRFRIAALNGGTQVQFSEIRLRGYVGKSIAGTVGSDGGEGNALDITYWGRNFFTPVLSNSECASVISGTSVTNAFDGIYRTNWTLFTLGDGYFPFGICYEIPASYLPDVEFIVTNYEVSVRNDVTDYIERSPRKWRLEGYCEEQSRWVVIDRQSDYDAWVTDSDKACRTSCISVAGNRYAFRKYRVNVGSVNGYSTYAKAWQLALTEIVLKGMWGKGIAAEVPQPSGMTVIVR